jgi:hypothetical protein
MIVALHLYYRKRWQIKQTLSEVVLYTRQYQDLTLRTPYFKPVDTHTHTHMTLLLGLSVVR